MVTATRLQEIRTLVGQLLDTPTQDLDVPSLATLIQDGIQRELAMRRSQAGGGCTLTLNALLAIGGQRLG